VGTALSKKVMNHLTTPVTHTSPHDFSVKIAWSEFIIIFIMLTCQVILSVHITDTMVDDVGDVDDSPRQSPKLPARIKPNYRQRKVRKTGLSTVELQKAMPELSELMTAKQSSLATSVLFDVHSRLSLFYSAVMHLAQADWHVSRW